MATGLTHEIIENDISFRDFVYQCARQMMPLISMRDKPMSEPIPEKLSVDQYYLEKRVGDSAALEYFTHLSHVRQLELYNIEMNKRDEEMAEGIAKENLIKERYEKMLAKVDAWEIPESLKNLRDFMRNQIKDSIRIDCGHYKGGTFDSLYARIPFEEWKATKIKNLKNQVAYSTEAHDREIERTEFNNAWLTDLHNAVGKE